MQSYMAKFKKNQLLKLIYKTDVLSSYILLGQSERRSKTQNIKLEEGGVEQNMSPQPTKVDIKMSAKPGRRRCRAAALSGRYEQDLRKQQGIEIASRHSARVALN